MPGRLSEPLATDAELLARGDATLLASWEAYAHGAPGAAVLRLPGVSAAVFPRPPERGVYNNALLGRDLATVERGAALDAMEGAYAQAGVRRFAAWAHEDDAALAADLERRGYAIDTTTRAMGMTLDAVEPGRPELDLAPPDLAAHLRVAGAPGGLLAHTDPTAFEIVVAREAGADVATGLAHHHAGDCGIYNVGTVPGARRRGHGTAVTALLVHDALARGCATASLQSSAIAEGVYSRLGFRDLGRILEYVPPSG